MPDIKLTPMLLALSLAASLLLYLLLSLLQPVPADRSLYLPAVLNMVQPRLIAGDRDAIEPELTQMVRGTLIQRIDLYEADGTRIASVRNANLQPAGNLSLRTYSGGIVIDSTLLANLSVEEYQAAVAMAPADRIFISLIAGLLVLGGGMLIARSRPAGQAVDEMLPGEIAGLPSSLGNTDTDNLCLAMVIRVADLQDGLLSRGELDEYGDTLWALLERMGPAYGICCLGVTEGQILLGANAANPSVALRHCIMFGWNIGGLSVDRYGRPATWIGHATGQDANASYSWMAGSLEGAAEAVNRCTDLESGQFEVCDSLQPMLPRSVEYEATGAGSVRIKSLDPAMLALWKRQLQSHQE